MLADSIKESSRLGKSGEAIQVTSAFDNATTHSLIKGTIPPYTSVCSSHSPTASKDTPSSMAAKPPKTRLLSNNAVNFIVDVVMLVAFMVVLTFAAIVQFIFPRGGAAQGVTLWSFDREGWLTGLNASIAVFGLLILLHLILHWSWVCSFVSSRLSNTLGRRIVVTESAKTLWGVAVLIAALTIMGIAVAAAEFCIRSTQ